MSGSKNIAKIQVEFYAHDRVQTLFNTQRIAAWFNQLKL